MDRAALPWPLPTWPPRTTAPPTALVGTEAWLAEQWGEILGSPAGGPDADFFASGGGSLAAAQLVVAGCATGTRTLSVRDIYQHPTLAALARRLDEAVAARRTTATGDRYRANGPRAADPGAPG